MATLGQFTGYGSYPVTMSKQVISSDMTFPSGYNGVSTDTVEIAAGVTVTVTASSYWTIIGADNYTASIKSAKNYAVATSLELL